MKRSTLEVCLALLVAGSALALPLSAAAEDTKLLYKCVNAKGVASIQSKPCPAGTTEEWKRASESEPKTTAAQAQAAQQREARNQQQVRELSAEVQRKVDASRPPTVIIGATPATAPTPTSERPSTPAVHYDSCQAAQAFATAVQEKTWIGLTDDQTRRIYGWVADQCRVVTKPED